MLESLASFARELGHFPVANEIKLKARTEPGFPWHNTFARFGGKQVLAARLRDFCLARGQHDVAVLCAAVIQRSIGLASGAQHDVVVESEFELGYVYLLKSGRYYKVGRTNAVGRRVNVSLRSSFPRKQRSFIPSRPMTRRV